MELHLCDLDPADERYCVADDRGTPYSYELACGEPAAALMKERGDDAMQLHLEESEGGLELPDVVPNTDNLLVLRKRCAEEILAAHDVGDHEALPVVLIDGRGRVHAKDYVVVNPFGLTECLDMERSEMNGDDEHPVVRIFGKFWLDASRVPQDRDIFRVKGLGHGYIFSERLVQFIRDRGFTNFLLQPVQLS